jgi:glycosyltransferase involved in cell wall biosynthesis
MVDEVREVAVRLFRRIRQAAGLLADGLLLVPAFLVLGIYAYCVRARKFRSVAFSQAACRLVILQPNVAAALRQHGADTIIENHFSPFPERICLLDPSGSEESESRIGENFRVISWRSPRSERSLKALGLLSTGEILGAVFTAHRLVRFLSTRNDNVLRSVMHDRTALYGWIASRALRLPHIIEVAGNYELLQRLLQFTYYFGNFYQLKWLRFPVKELSNWLLGLPLRQAHRVIGRNKNNYEHAFALGANVDRLSLVRIRIAEKFFDRDPGGTTARPPDFRYMLFVARLAPEKRPLDCIDIFERTASVVDDVHLVIIGEGPLMPSVKERQKSSVYADRIHVLGALPNAEVMEWTRGASIGLELYSGSSLVEKMSCGIPVVAYDIEWMSEVVIDGYTGHTADFLDFGGMAAHCVKILRNPIAAAKMADRSRELAEVLFDRSAIIQKEDGYLLKAVREFSNQET